MGTSSHQRNIHQQLILEHSKTPRHKGKTDPVHCSHWSHDPYCGDRIELFIRLSNDRDIIEDIKFQGEGCAIAIASADLMAEALAGKTIVEALEKIEAFRNLVKGETISSTIIPKLTVFQGISKFPLRIKCATLSWHVLKSILIQEMQR